MQPRPLGKEFTKGIFAQNAVFVLAVGLCPTLAVTTSLKNAVAMGLAVIFVLLCASTLVSLLRNVIPDQVRIPCFIVIIGSFVTMVEIIFKGKLPPELNASLGIFIPLIVVNCIILYRAESFAYKHGFGRSILDALGIGVGFTLAICLVASVREVLGAGTIWGYPWMPSSWNYEYAKAAIMVQAPGAFLALGLLLGFFNWIRQIRESRTEG
jgi:electron transport complex protein RnfE